MTPTWSQNRAQNRALPQSWCRVDDIDGCAVVIAGGDFTVDQCAKLTEALVRSGECFHRVVVDLSQVEAIEPTAFGMVLRRLHGLREDHVKLGVVGPSAVVRRSLQASVLDEVFGSYDTVTTR
jgi:anti-anti-sigma factor